MGEQRDVNTKLETIPGTNECKKSNSGSPTAFQPRGVYASANPERGR